MLLLWSAASGQGMKDLNIDFMLRGHIYASSSIPDTQALGGFASSDNFPRKISDSTSFPEAGFFLKIDTGRVLPLNGKFNGYAFYMVNKSDTTIKLNASDSRLPVIAEVFYKGRWKPIEYLPASFCGNSYHRVYLKQNEYWEFVVPKFSGKIKTRLRYRLMTDQGHFIYSNEIQTRINEKQLTSRQEYTPDGIMDPYRD